MDQLHSHLKELLDTIAQLHSYQQTQFAHQLNSLKQQQQQQQQIASQPKQELTGQLNGVVNTGLASTASIGATVTSALLVSTSVANAFPAGE